MQQKIIKSMMPHILNLARTTLLIENLVDISNSLIPYIAERVLSVTAKSARKGINDDIIHIVLGFK